MTEKPASHFDAIIVGAGFAGMYMAYLLRERGFAVKGFERGSDVGGTWYWNRYPGCRCDVESIEYSYAFSSALQQKWDWKERYAPQEEILNYARYVARRFALRPLFQFDTSITGAHWQEEQKRWSVETDTGEQAQARYLIMATGCLSAANIPDFAGRDSFQGPTYHTGAWPHEGVDFSGQNTAVIGTGSSGIQSIPLIAKQAKHLTVFQRTPNYSVPARNKPLAPQIAAEVKADYPAFRARALEQMAAIGGHYPRGAESALSVSAEEREKRFEEYWQHGGFIFLGAFNDIVLDPRANEFAAEFVRKKIRSIVKNPATAELLCPDSVLACKRLCADTGYFETYNLPHVALVDVSKKPIEKMTPAGLTAGGKNYQFDSIVFATGFDAMTGALLRCDIRGQDGLNLREKWAAGPKTYLGLMIAGFPNMFTMSGPGSPSVLSNMIISSEHHAEFIADFISWANERQYARLEASPAAEEDWVETVNMRAEATLFPRCNSWYLGANVAGKPRVFMPYVGFPDYAAKTKETAAKDYEGFSCR